MVLALSYAIQANATDSLSADEWKALGMIAHGHAGSTQSAAQNTREPKSKRARPRPIARSIKPGTRLLREWQGRIHAVIADTDDHLPNSSGKSRHGEPVRAIQKMASNSRRLSEAGRPPRPRTENTKGSKNAHSASPISERAAITSVKATLNQTKADLGIPFVNTA